MTKILALLADGFEDLEFTVLNDIYKRLEMEVQIASCTKSLELTSYFGLKLKADMLLSAVSQEKMQEFDALILVGGPRNSSAIAGSDSAMSFIKDFADSGKYILSQCSACVRQLAKLGLVQGKRFTCPPALISELTNTEGATYEQDLLIVQDGKLFTSIGPGVSFEFALITAIELLGDKRKVIDQAVHMGFYNVKKRLDLALGR